MVTTHDLPTLAGMCLGLDSPGPMLENLERVVGPVTGRPPAEVAVEVHGHLGRSPAMVAAATLEDLVGVVERPNVPGTLAHERPNWSRALPVLLDDLPEHADATRSLRALGEMRRRH